MLAFRLACPNRLEQADAQRLFDILYQQGRLITLNMHPMERGVPAAFSIDIDTDAQPSSVRAGDQPRDNNVSCIPTGFSVS